MLFISLLIGGCSDSSSTKQLVTTPVNKETTINTRGHQNYVATKAYHYKTLTSFKKGKVDVSLNDLAALIGKPINLVVLYEASAPWAEVFDEGKYHTTGNDHLNGLMSTYNLDIVKQFYIDADNEGLVLEPNMVLPNPIKAAKELSLIDHVLMVEIKEIPRQEVNTSTADIK